MAEYLLLELIQQWFDDALKDNLIKTDKGDFYEPFRIENADIILLKIPVEDYFLETYDFPGCICYKIDSHGMNLYTRECGIKSDKQDIGVLLFRSCKLVCKKWFVKQPKTLGDLLSFALENDFVIDKSKIKDAISSQSSCPENIFFQFAFVRPVRVIGKESKIDYLTFCAKLEDYLSNHTDATVHSVQMIDFATPKLANYISNTPDDVANKNILILGCGAIGSKLIYHLYRSGICNLTICDKDTFLSHNVCRHALTKPGLIESKVKLVKKELDSMFLMNSDKVKIVEQDILQWLPSADLSKYDLLIDATASASVFRLLDKIAQNTSIPVVHFALSDAGNIGHVYINTKRDTLLSDYYMYLTQESVVNDDVSGWLKRESKYNLDLIRIGEGCHSKTMRLGDDVISTHTGIAASIIKSALARDLNNTVYLSYVNIEYDGQVFTERYSVPYFFSCKCSNNDEWQIRIPDSLLKKIQREAKIAGKKEVGGYLMGNIDVKHKTVYVLHQFKPDDSKQRSSKLRLGTKGWREEYLKVKERSAGMLDYIGDWHSHPSGSLEMSTTDILTNYAIKTEEIPSDYGLCIITNSSTTAAYLLAPGIKIYIVEE